jgi:galactokinase
VGEHTDYNKGLVLPAAVDRYVIVKASADRPDGAPCYVSSSRYGDGFEWLPGSRASGWRNYAGSVLAELHAIGIDTAGVSVLIDGNLPAERGLGSSGAFEVGLALAVLGLRRVDLPRMDLAALCLRAENVGVGVESEIMDPFISLFGRRDNAVFLDTRSMSYRYLPLPADCGFVLIDSGRPRSLADSEFNQRRHECNEALEVSRRVFPGLKDLSAIRTPALRELAPVLSPILMRRVRHIVTENERVERAVDALLVRDLATVCQIMYESHESLRVDYQTSSAELDAIVDGLRGSGLPAGAKLCGAGFGGAVICCVVKPDKDRLRKIAEIASAAVGSPVAVERVRPRDGAYLARA